MYIYSIYVCIYKYIYIYIYIYMYIYIAYIYNIIFQFIVAHTFNIGCRSRTITTTTIDLVQNFNL